MSHTPPSMRPISYYKGEVKSVTALAAFILLFCCASPVQADKRLPYKATKAELSSLPEYCIARLAGDDAAQKPWRDKIGNEIYIHIHHFCAGLVHARRAQTQFSSKHRKYYAGTAIKEFNYVLSRWPADFSLAVEARNQKAQIELQLKFMTLKHY